jgi:hypothetical protein
MFSFCKPVSSRKRFTPHRAINDEFFFTLFDKASLVNGGEWDAVTGGSTIFLEREYLHILEGAGHARLACRYAIVYRLRKPCGVIYFQVTDFKAGMFGALMRKEVEAIKEQRKNLFERYIESNKDEVLMRLFTCGNNLISGEYGFHFLPEVSRSDAHELVIHITGIVAKEERLRGTISAILLKDFYEGLVPDRLMASEGYTSFSVEPNMVIAFPAGLKDLNDYVSLFSKKYRNRARAVLRGREGLEIKELGGAEIESVGSEMFELYSALFEQARFKLLKLPSDYFSMVKKLYPESFRVSGFFLEKRLVAFASSFNMPDGSVEAHYIGFDHALNTTYNLYQNILYDLISFSVSCGASRLNLGRTAAEMKSTVGAVPVDLLCYIKPQNAISRLVQRPFISFLQPGEWIMRNPFRG